MEILFSIEGISIKTSPFSSTSLIIYFKENNEGLDPIES